MTTNEFEQIFVKLIFTNIQVREKVLPYLKAEIFDDFACKQFVKVILYFETKYQKFPNVADLKLKITDEDLYNSLTSILNTPIEDYTTEYLLNEIEIFIKKKLTFNIIGDVAVGLKDDIKSITDTPEKLRDALSFSFDETVGLDFFDASERLYEYANSRDYFIPTGLKTLDKWIDGGFHEKSLTLIVCQVNGGKSAIKCAFGCNCLLRNKKVLYITLEMSEEKIAERFMFNLFDMTRDEMRQLSREAFLGKFKTLRSTINSNLIIKEYPTKSANTNHFRNLIKEVKQKRNFVPDIIFVDYLAIMLPNAASKGENSYGEQKRIAQELRALSMEMKIPIVSSVQVNREGFGKMDIDMDNISDSIGVAFDSDILIAATQNDDLRKSNKYMFNIIKNRYGLNKIIFPVNVDFYKMRLWDDEKEEIKQAQPEIKKDSPVDFLKKKEKESIDFK